MKHCDSESKDKDQDQDELKTKATAGHGVPADAITVIERVPDDGH